MSNIKTENILVRVQDTPNPYALKFIVNYPLKNQGKATFSDVSEAQGLSLVEGLINLLGVKQVYFFENTVTITHEGLLPAEELKDFVIAVINTRLPIHDANFVTEKEKNQFAATSSKKEHTNEKLNEMEEILDRTIRPGLQADGGDLEIISFDNDELRIMYQGACGGCPSAMMGTLDAIQGILRQEMSYPELLVVPI